MCVYMNCAGTSDYDRDGQVISEEEYEEVMDKLKAADSLYTEYTLEEIIYQLAKVPAATTLLMNNQSYAISGITL